MVSGESETFVSRVRRVSARARRVETKPLDVSVGRVYSQTVGAVRWGWGDGSRRVTSRGAPSRTARALNALVTVVMVRAFHSTLFKLWRRGRRARRAGLGVRAPTSNSKRAFFTRAFQRQSHVSNRANRQDFARLPLAEEIARIYCQRQTPTTRSHRASHRRD